jgi:hypothetical protein
MLFGATLVQHFGYFNTFYYIIKTIKNQRIRYIKVFEGC